jgi:hypothetical protein
MGNNEITFGHVSNGVMTSRQMGSMESPFILCINSMKCFVVTLQGGKGVVGVGSNI